MKDVRHLWLSARMVMIVSWILCALCLILILILEGLRGVRSLFSGLKEAFVCLMVVLVFFGFWCLIDFTGFWTWFHTIVFPGNMDWLLDPATDFMIVICPEEMFSSMVFLIAGKLLAGLAPVAGLCLLARKTLPVYLDGLKLEKGSKEDRTQTANG